MATQGAPGFNPAYLVDPGLYSSQQAISQQQELAAMLMKEGLTPTGGIQMAGRVAIGTHPMEGIAKIAQLLSGQSMLRQSNQAGQDLQQRQMQAMLQLHGGGQPQGDPSQGDPSQQPQGQLQGQALGQALTQGQGGSQGQGGGSTPAGVFSLPGMTPMQSMISQASNPDKYMESFIKGYTPNETTIQARQGGFDPAQANRMAFAKANTAGGVLEQQQAGMTPDQIQLAALSKAIKDADMDRKAGNQYKNGMTGESGVVGKLPEGSNVTGPPGPNGQVSVAAMPGGPGVMSSNSAATTAGTNTQTPDIGYVNGQPVNTTKAARVRDANGPSGRVDLAAIDYDISKEKDPAIRAQLMASRNQYAVKQGDKPITPEQAPGVVTGANDAQKQMGERFQSLRDTVSAAQTTNSYLDNIKQLSAVAATGKFSDKLDYANALLAPLNVKANDAKTANDLLNKYSNQIVSRLSTGGLGTDAARTILGSAYPNAHMTKDAIGEAVDNIKAVNDMQVSKLQALSPHGNSRDAAAYQKAEQAFDTTADPRIFQIAKMPPAQAAQFIGKMPPAVQAELRQRAQALKQMGAL